MSDTITFCDARTDASDLIFNDRTIATWNHTHQVEAVYRCNQNRSVCSILGWWSKELWSSAFICFRDNGSESRISVQAWMLSRLIQLFSDLATSFSSLEEIEQISHCEGSALVSLNSLRNLRINFNFHPETYFGRSIKMDRLFATVYLCTIGFCTRWFVRLQLSLHHDHSFIDDRLSDHVFWETQSKARLAVGHPSLLNMSLAGELSALPLPRPSPSR